MALIFRNILLTLGRPVYALVCPATIVLFGPWALSGRQSFYWPVTLPGHAGALMFIVGCGIVIWCIFSSAYSAKRSLSDAPTPVFMVNGLYRYVRNPMCIGLLLILAGELISFPSIAMAIYLLCVFIACHLYILFIEEPRMLRKFGKAYQTYMQEVGRWIPGKPFKKSMIT